MKPGETVDIQIREGAVGIFTVPSYFATARLRASILAADAEWKCTELLKRYKELLEDDEDGAVKTVDAEGVPESDFEAYERWQIVGLADTLELLMAYAENEVEINVDEARGMLENDPASHDGLRRARAVLFFGGGSSGRDE